jgi:DNA-binding response OmpR family regulator
MTTSPNLRPRVEVPPTVILALEDHREANLLGFQMQRLGWTARVAQDGEAALQMALSQRPLAILADLRLPRRNGLELCSVLRRDPELAEVPILLFSGTFTEEERIEVLRAGGDEVLQKPFSNEALFALLRRLIARATEAERHRRRALELERDLARSEADARRARETAVHEHDLRTLVAGVADGLLRTVDLEALDARVLREVCQRTGARSAALLERDGERFVVRAVRGDLHERWRTLELAQDGVALEWARMVVRPVRRSELERVHGAHDEVLRLARYGVSLLGALHGPDAIEGVIVCEDRPDGAGFGSAAFDRFAALCGVAAPARTVARRFTDQQDRALAMLFASVSSDGVRREAAQDSRDRLLGVAEHGELEPAQRAALGAVLELGPWAWSDAGRSALAGLALTDPTPRVQQLCTLFDRARAVADGMEEGDLLTRLAAAGLRYQSLRMAGRSRFEAWRTTAMWLGVLADPALSARFPEAFEAGR